MNIHPALQKRWIPPNSSNSHKRKKITFTPQTTTKSPMYYPLYGGYMSSDSPILFKQPSYALAWSLTRFKRDGLGNAWHGTELPLWMRYVGLIYFEEEHLTKIPLPYSHRKSQLEHHYFSSVDFYLLNSSSTTGSSSQYIMADQEVFDSCLNTLHPFQDYQMSSTSLYIRGQKCPIHPKTSFSNCKSTFLDDKLAATTSGFIQVEKKFIYLKNNVNNDLGECLSHSKSNFCIISSDLIFSYS